MNVLCLNQFFWPDLAPTSQLLTGLTRALVREGHTATVICGDSVYAGSNNSEQPPGVQVIRLPKMRFSRRMLGRIFGYASFFIFALWSALRAEKPDVVITMTTPPLLSLVGTLIKKLRGARHFIWEMDLYPDIAVDLGLIQPNSFLANSIGALADAQRRSADGVIALGECMKDRLVAHGLAADRIHVVDNWADSKVFHPRSGVPKLPLSIVYPGNFGLGHDYETLARALPVLERDGRFHFTFIGAGTRYAQLKSWCSTHSFRNVVFKPYCAVTDLACKELPISHIGLVLQDLRCSGSIVPSKLYPLLASGLPIIFIGPGSATPARIINRFGCGWHIECGDSDGFIELLHRLADCTSLLEQAGAQARQTFLDQFDIEIGIHKIFNALGLENRCATAAPMLGKSHRELAGW